MGQVASELNPVAAVTNGVKAICHDCSVFVFNAFKSERNPQTKIIKGGGPCLPEPHARLFCFFCFSKNAGYLIWSGFRVVLVCWGGPRKG